MKSKLELSGESEAAANLSSRAVWDKEGEAVCTGEVVGGVSKEEREALTEYWLGEGASISLEVEVSLARNKLKEPTFLTTSVTISRFLQIDSGLPSTGYEDVAFLDVATEASKTKSSISVWPTKSCSSVSP